MQKQHYVLTAVLALCMAAGASQAEEVRSPYQIVADAPADDWRPLDAANTIYMDLPTGRVVIELMPEFAPHNVANIKALVREGFYEGLSIYRVVDGFVAQGGDESGEKPIKTAKRAVNDEFTRQGLGTLSFIPLMGPDGYADETGFVKSHPVGRDKISGEAWLVHCPGAVTISRGEQPDSSGPDFAISLGHAPRYLDRNITMIGHVMYGMEHLQKLERGSEAMGIVPDAQVKNGIIGAHVAADLAPEKQVQVEVMRSDSPSFKELIQSRSNRPEAWFVKRHNYMDVCGIPVPVRKAN